MDGLYVSLKNVRLVGRIRRWKLRREDSTAGFLQFPDQRREVCIRVKCIVNEDDRWPAWLSRCTAVEAAGV